MSNAFTYSRDKLYLPLRQAKKQLSKWDLKTVNGKVGVAHALQEKLQAQVIASAVWKGVVYANTALYPEPGELAKYAAP